MKAWVVTSEAAEVQIIVFAETRGRAKTLALKTDWLEAEDYADIRCRREPKLDAIAKEKGEHIIDGSLVSHARIMRGLGWRAYDGRIDWCEKCGLYEWEGLSESHLTETETGHICVGCLESIL
jgi:broad specificity phosphatase PhoE